MDREKLDESCEKGMLGLLLGILIFGPLALGANRAWSFLCIEVMTLLILLLWVARLWIAKNPKILWPPICWVVVAFMGWAIYQYKQADIEYIARWEMVRVLIYGFLFLAIVNNLHGQENKQTIGMTLVFLALLISGYAVYQVFSKVPKVYNIDNSQYGGRGSGTFIYPNNLAGFLEMILPIGLAYVFIGRLSHLTKILLCYACFGIVVGIAATVSRGGYIVTGASLLVLCGILLTQRDYRLQGAVLMLAVLVGMGLAITQMSSMRQRVERMVHSGKADDMRLALWTPAKQMWHDHFWTGVGPGLFDYKFGAYRPVQVQMRPLYVHNDYLNTLADWGVIGFAMVALALVMFYWGVFSNWKIVRGGRNDFSRKKSNKFALLVGGAIGIFAILLHSFVDFNMRVPSNAILAITLMALISSQWRFATESFWFRAGIVLRSAITILILAGMGYLGYWATRAAKEYYWLYAAEKLNTRETFYFTPRITALEQAAKAEPMNFTTLYELGECYRLKSWDGADDNYKDWGHKGLATFMQAAKLNPYDAMTWIRAGMCVDKTGYHSIDGTHDDSSAYYLKANDLDPNNYFVTVNTGWHYLEIGDLAAARTWFERSLRFEWKEADNQIAYNYLKILDRRMKENAAAQSRN